MSSCDVLQVISQDLYIIGLIAAAACALSVIMGVIYFLFTLCGGAGSHICCAAVPVGFAFLSALYLKCHLRVHQIGLHCQVILQKWTLYV